MANVQDRGPPSTVSVVLATAIVSGLAGYYLGQARSIGLFGKAGPSTAADDDKESDLSDDGSADEDEDVQDLGELKSFADSREECKLVLVVRTDLGMTKGRCGISQTEGAACDFCLWTTNPAMRCKQLQNLASAAALKLFREQ